MNPERGILRSRGADGAHDRDSATRVGLVTPENEDGAQIRDREERVRWPAAPAQLTREWSSSIHMEVLIRIPPRFVLEDATAVPERGKTPELLPGVHRKASVRPQRLATRRPSTQSILALIKTLVLQATFPSINRILQSPGDESLGEQQGVGLSSPLREFSAEQSRVLSAGDRMANSPAMSEVETHGEGFGDSSSMTLAKVDL